MTDSKQNWSPIEGLLSHKYRRTIYLAALALTIITLLTFYSAPISSRRTTTTTTTTTKTATSSGHKGEWDWDWRRDAGNLLMTDEQCGAAFPGLFVEIERAMDTRKENKITFEELDAIKPQYGYGRAMIYDQQLYIISIDSTVYSRTMATLHAIHRAILTSPEPLPNIEFTFIVNDKIDPTTTWALTRRAADTDIWLMPDFGYYSWPETKVGTYAEVQQKILAAEHTSPWSSKRAKLVWRGAPMTAHNIRQHLVDVTAGKSWADVKYLDWNDKPALQRDLLAMPDHCGYKFVAHTEGASYSGRLKYLQNCRSVVVAHRLQWIQHHHPLLVSEGPEQNFVEVDDEFVGLEAAMEELLADDARAERIAGNAVRVFRERYLTGAAEVCYWRRLVRGWRDVSFEPSFYDEKGEWRGVPAESYFLMGKVEWEPY
ncbi:uncharacterized protein LAJ45_10048 [Morchella importuna]|uniref:uncharacterized protein n=1 Tax=Morchella importuna TaxID=1174673 RepID=UPI001E8D3B78|nr:uncharacterized protein LAJ45_10048 [Morchella importuna]KAH8145906.1 hypothetical protein LAJ45_10048 [Morchella importuna]